jgi:phosphatidylserine/phosphatidylglycerophosphate/cardiolipin synthase-like enzyme
VSPELEPLHRLSSANLQALAISLRHGELSSKITYVACCKLLGGSGNAVFSCLNYLGTTGMLPGQCALLVQAIAGERERAPDPARLFELVLTGPDVSGVPTEDTVAVVNTLFQEARSEVLLISYAVFNGERIFETLVARMRENPSLKVTFCLDIPRRFGDTTPSSEIVKRFATDFRKKHWPWPELPEVYYYPRSLSQTTDQRASLHAKAVVVDRRAALITSANLTEAAQLRNIEAGLLVRYEPIARRIVDYTEGLIHAGELFRCRLE